MSQLSNGLADMREQYSGSLVSAISDILVLFTPVYVLVVESGKH